MQRDHLFRETNGDDRVRRVDIDDLDTATAVEVEVRREDGYLSLLLWRAFRLPTSGNPSIAG